MKCKTPNCQATMSEGAPDYCPKCQQIRDENETKSALRQTELAFQIALGSVVKLSAEITALQELVERERGEAKGWEETAVKALHDLRDLLKTEQDCLEQMTMLANGIHEDEGRAAALIERAMRFGLDGTDCYSSREARETGHAMREFLAGRSVRVGLKLNQVLDEQGKSLDVSCGDCDPCIGGRPDQCAVGPRGRIPRCGACNLPVTKCRCTESVRIASGYAP